MGTRGIVSVHDKNLLRREPDDALVVIYHHLDSYPAGLGQRLAEFLEIRTMVRGLDVKGELLNKGEKIVQVNGLDDLAAQLVTYLKQSDEASGMVYIFHHSALDDLLKDGSSGIDFWYKISLKDDRELYVDIYDLYGHHHVGGLAYELTDIIETVCCNW